MVSIQQKASIPSGASHENTQAWTDAVSQTFAPTEANVIRQACEVAEPLYEGRTELTGAPLMQHALGAASILIGMNMDHETIAATILHAVPEYMEGWADALEARFGPTVKMLVEGISRMEHVRQFSEMPEHGEREKKRATMAVRSRACGRCCWQWFRISASC